MKQVYRCQDEYGSIKVMDEGNKRYLFFGEGVEQSCQLKTDPHLLQHDYSRAMMLVLLFKQPNSLLMFGLGGGCLATALHTIIPSLTLQLIELRPRVVPIAHRYFQLPESQRIKVINADAGEFLLEPAQAKVDLLFSDIFDEDGCDAQQLQPWFIESCHQHLTDDGWLVMNCWQQQRGDTQLLATVQRYFKDVKTCFTAEGNWIIFAGKKICRHSTAELKRQEKKWSKLLGYSIAAYTQKLKNHVL